MKLLHGIRVALPARQQLLDRLFDETENTARGQRITLFLAPTGYGKTRTAASWLGDGSNDDWSVRWINCAPNSSQTLWRSIFNELAHIVRGPFEPSLDAQADATRLAENLEHAITIVIDDYHHATSLTNDLALAEFSGASPLLDLVVIGRRVNVLASPLVTARTRVRVIDADSLALTTDERHQLATALGIAPSTWLDSTLELSEGWPLAIRGTLNLGADTAYLSSKNTDAAEGRATIDMFDPMANLRSFALSYFQLASGQARRVILATALIDAINLQQVRQVLDASPEEAQAAVNELLELGLLREITAIDGLEYRCHKSMRDPLNKLATQVSTPTQQEQLMTGRAKIIEATAPFTAFGLYCKAEEFAAAETLLARNFTTFIDEGEACGRILRSLTETVQRAHPTFTAALLFLETPKPSVSPTTLAHLTNLWLQSLQLRLPDQTPAESDPIYLPLLCQAMVATRVTNQVDASLTLMRSLESRIISDSGSVATPSYSHENASTSGSALSGSLPTYYREVAATALTVSDFVRARRTLELLRQHSERRIQTPWHGFGYASIRTVTEQQAGQRWLLAALSELAFTELLDGNMRRCAELVAEFDAHVAEAGEPAPGISWVGAEVSRAHLANELRDPALLKQATTMLAPLKDRLEHWPLLLIAEATSLRNERGPDWAIAHLHAELSNEATSTQGPGKWISYFTSFQAMLCTTSGDLSQADSLLNECTPDTTRTRLERARLALFASDDVGALLITQSIGDPGATIRQRADRCLISAVAAWGLGRREDAFTALSHAADYTITFELPSILQNVPYDTLAEVAIAAKSADVCDLTTLVNSVPDQARSIRYERLTEMERKTLLAIAEHRNANQAAASLHLTPGTIKKHLVSVYKKLRVNGRDEAILQASRMGLLRQA